jgi:16S rRNA (adenine1518-N6/adenine1519-N6)-dimethyltransferase
MSFRAKKSMGQNFLVDENICRKIIAALDVVPGDSVLEIGPGQGALTGLISGRGANVYALEKDRELCRVILEKYPGVDIVCTDALTFNWFRLECLDRIKIVGNLPYNIASRLLWDMACQIKSFDRAVFMVQKEVGQRIVSSPGSKSYGGLSVWIQSFLRPEILFKVSPAVFRPRPKVDSVVLKFTPLDYEEKKFSSQNLSKTIRIMFQHRRKQVGKILRTYWNDELNSFFEEQDLEHRFRPEDLTPADFQGLSRKLFPGNQQILS